jgi:hypothetical protein
MLLPPAPDIDFTSRDKDKVTVYCFQIMGMKYVPEYAELNNNHTAAEQGVTVVTVPLCVASNLISYKQLPYRKTLCCYMSEFLHGIWRFLRSACSNVCK